MKTALVVSGGGSHGAFSVGVVKKLFEHGIKFNLVVGTSTGALIAPLVAIGDIALLEDIYATATTENIVELNQGLTDLRFISLHTLKGLEALIVKHISEERYKDILKSEVEIFIVTVSLESSEVHYWNPKRSGKDNGPLDIDTFRMALLASASMPILTPPVLINGEHHADGGVREIAPLKKAIDEGAEAIYAVISSPEQHVSVPLNTSDILPIRHVALRVLNGFTTEVLTNDLDIASLYNRAYQYQTLIQEKALSYLTPVQQAEVFAEEQGITNPFKDTKLINLYKFRPKAPLPLGTLEFVPEKMREMIATGEALAEKLLPGKTIDTSREAFGELLAQMREEAGIVVADGESRTQA